MGLPRLLAAALVDQKKPVASPQPAGGRSLMYEAGGVIKWSLIEGIGTEVSIKLKTKLTKVKECSETLP